MSVFRNLHCLSLVACSNTTLLKLQTVLFLLFFQILRFEIGGAAYLWMRLIHGRLQYQLALHKTPITLEALSQTTEICGFQDKFSWMIIPRNLSPCTHVKGELFNYLIAFSISKRPNSLKEFKYKSCHEVIHVSVKGNTVEFVIFVLVSLKYWSIC